MGRFLILLCIISALLFVLRYWQSQRQRRSRTFTRKGGAREQKVKSKGRLIQDPKTGQYRVEPDDKEDKADKP